MGLRVRFFVSFTVASLAFGLLAPKQTFADNLRLIESRPGGFAIYRSGSPTAADFKHWCKIGIQEVYVVSGNADKIEDKLAPLCPSIKILASEAQDTDTALDGRVLELFDRWVQDAIAKNKKVLFRCNCGCHRTGRLAAYYQMKYQNLTADDAIALMNHHGKLMMFHPELPPQVRELEGRIRRERQAAYEASQQIATDDARSREPARRRSTPTRSDAAALR